ncbi:Mur ligase family protein [Nesterenkonia populi]|uniref:Mur ligase family protein n=1 Tax=Nesterenkonia populi TaxID=1591087 RepID=UPI001FEA59FF|nr:Mur ligase family protein [Nesterenkonia populi]
MSLPHPRSLASVALGRAARLATRFRGGSGSAFPGLVVEKADPDFLARTLSQLPRGVVVVSGTNGKTTTTKMVVELLRGQGLRVATNRSGSNFTRGVVASLLGEVNAFGKLNADIAVLELDEAHAVHFVKAVRPNHSLLLNVMRDQLDRFGEIDTTAGLLRTIAEHTTDGIVLNREDHRVARIADSVPGRAVSCFGLGPAVKHHFPSDDDLHADSGSAARESPEHASVDADAPPVPADVVLSELTPGGGTFLVGGERISTQLRVTGAYNVYNAAAALALVRQALGDDADAGRLIESLALVAPAFGRGESLTVNGQPLDLVLVKNPAGFRLGLSSFPHAGTATMIAINDDYADGRDMSWLWDVSFEVLAEHGVAVTSGVRAYDMALRLTYDHVHVGSAEPDLGTALKAFVAGHPETPKRIYCTYTAMLAIRRHLAAYTEVEDFA